MTTSSPNPLLRYAQSPDALGGLPPFATIAADHVVPCIDALLGDLAAGRADLEARLEQRGDDVAYGDIVEGLADLTEPLERAWGVVGHLMGTRNEQALREAQQAAQPKVVLALMELSQSEPVFRALSRLQASPTFASLTPSRRRIVEKRLVDAKLSGIGLAGAAKDRFNAIEQELSEQSTRFSNHVLDATKAWSLTLTTADEVDGLPPSWRAMASAAAAAAEGPGNPAVGPWKVTLDFPSYGPFLRYATRRDLRERVYRASIGRASELDAAADTDGAAGRDNRPLIARILQLRHEKAQLLGYASYADVSLAQKMAPSVAAVHQLLDELRAVSRPVAEDELAELERLAGHPIRQWDVEFFAEKLREQRYAYSEEDLRQYFPFPAVLEGLFALLKRLFGIDVVEATGEVQRWHDDVRFFRVRRDGQAIAAFFLDPYARPENKRGGAWMDDCVTRRVVAGRAMRLPVAYLVCNQPPPVGGKPSLLPFRDVETLFHEFGHGLQHMLTTVDDVDASGIRGVEWDAVELPSQFMENWCTHEATVMGFARHVESGAPLPSPLFAKLKAARTFRAASMMLRQLMFAAIDLKLHEGPLPPGTTVFDVQRAVAKDNAVLPVLPEDRFLCAFTHIFSGGYAAGYYSYKWAEVLSADAFGAFEDEGVDDPTVVARVGARFRDTVLALGGSAHPLEVFQAFRGRPPSTTALLRHAGLLRAA
ncbi:MAG: M3 family metallopeptidase [Deltaproteobacteria bacterium]|nr:M3 family metallopeptidase [Deltaproteobacteria bacterium]